MEQVLNKLLNTAAGAVFELLVHDGFIRRVASSKKKEERLLPPCGKDQVMRAALGDLLIGRWLLLFGMRCIQK